MMNSQHGVKVSGQGVMLITGKAVDYFDGFVCPGHEHATAQLIHAVQGVIVVSTEAGQWIVPPTRGLWMPANVKHQSRMVGEVHLRTVYIEPDIRPGLPRQCQVVKISPLLRELILASIDVEQPCAIDSREGRIVGLLLDEVALLPTLPLQLPQPTDSDLRMICGAIVRAPDDASTLNQWAERLAIDPKTIQRRFARQTGMTFGQWRQQARLIMALEQLASGVKVVDVACNLGYSSPSAFTTMFKRQLGVTPNAYFS